MQKKIIDSIYTLPPKNDSPLITQEEILYLMERYRIGRKPLAILLGWGNTTILRYLNGVTPAQAYSDKLRRLAKEPGYYYDVLTNNSTRITEVAYRKSLNAVMMLLLGTKLNVTAQYIINRSGGDTSARRVQAILYYSQVFSLALRNVAIFDEDYQITTNHMPYPTVYDSIRSQGCHVISLPPDAISAADRAVIDSIYNALEWYGPEALRIITASERSVLIKSRSRTDNKTITKQALRNIFCSVAEQYHITKPSEINSYFNKRLSEIRKRKTT